MIIDFVKIKEKKALEKEKKELSLRKINNKRLRRSLSKMQTHDVEKLFTKVNIIGDENDYYDRYYALDCLMNGFFHDNDYPHTPSITVEINFNFDYSQKFAKNIEIEKKKSQKKAKFLQKRRNKLIKWCGTPDLSIKRWVPLWLIWLLYKIKIFGPKFTKTYYDPEP